MYATVTSQGMAVERKLCEYMKGKRKGESHKAAARVWLPEGQMKSIQLCSLSSIGDTAHN